VYRYESNNKDHVNLSDLSKRCHDAAAAGNAQTVTALEEEIDRSAARLWRMTGDELRAIRDALAEMNPGKAKAQPDEESDDE